MIAKRANRDPDMRYDEYLALEERGEGKHEYVRGQIFAMAGGTPEHSALAAATIAALSAVLRGKPCRVYTGDLRVRIEATDIATYPDVAVVCGKLETAKDDRNAATNPVLLVEVLSESTERHDRGAKFAHYRHIASLREYVLVDLWDKEDGVWRIRYRVVSRPVAPLAPRSR